LTSLARIHADTAASATRNPILGLPATMPITIANPIATLTLPSCMTGHTAGYNQPGALFKVPKVVTSN